MHANISISPPVLTFTCRDSSCDFGMEIALAAGCSAVFSAVSAALHDSPEFRKKLNDKIAAVQALMPNAKPPPHMLLHAALGSLPVAVDADKRSLDGSRRGLKTEDLITIAQALQAAPPGTILKLNLSHTVVAKESASALGESHLALARLAALRMRGCNLGDHGVVPILRALHHPEAAASSRLTELALASNGLTAASAGELAHALRELPALLSLDLSYNALGPDGCALVAEALAERRVLEALSLASTGLDDLGITRLAAALCDVPLGELDLDGNGASDSAVGALLGMAAGGMPLSSLRLSANAVGAQGARAIAAHLTSRPGGPLRSLSLSNNPLTANGCEALRACLGSNQAITELALTGTGGAADCMTAIAESIARNRASQRQASRMPTKALLRAASASAASAASAASGSTASGQGAPTQTAARGALDPSSAYSVQKAIPTEATPRGGQDGGDAPPASAIPAAPTTPADAPFSQQRQLASPTRFDTPAAFASGFGVRADAAEPSFSPSFAPTGDLSVGVVRQRRQLFLMPSGVAPLLLCACPCISSVSPGSSRALPCASWSLSAHRASSSHAPSSQLTPELCLCSQVLLT